MSQDWMKGLRSEVRDGAKALLSDGWEYDRTSGKSHPRLLWPATGERLSLPSTPSDVRSMRNVLAAARRISGIRPAAHAGPHFHFVKAEPLDLKRAAHECAAHAKKVDDLWLQLHDIETAIRLLNPVRDQQKCRQYARAAVRVRQSLASLGADVSDFPNTA